PYFPTRRSSDLRCWCGPSASPRRIDAERPPDRSASRGRADAAGVGRGPARPGPDTADAGPAVRAVAAAKAADGAGNLCRDRDKESRLAPRAEHRAARGGTGPPPERAAGTTE